MATVMPTKSTPINAIPTLNSFPFVIAAPTAVAAGAMLTMLVDTMIPKACAETHSWVGLIAFLGFLS